ncbi:MAG: TIGR03960 family B12-binding radical SAM protein [Clostridia bacterium]|nr:TIGR03960 family B12-binding radical SAM protein [Clostridia bacterium]
MLRDKVYAVLSQVEKPARYIGNEWNIIRKSWDDAAVKMVFAYPDTYEIGMSHLGLQILYGLINSREDFLMERVFAPWVDMEEKMRRLGIPLFSLESFRPVKDFDVVGFTLQYELNYTNILNMLDLAGIPIKSSDRGDEDPLVVAGGPCAFNPEPLSSFFDFFLIGDAEEALLEILELLKESKLSQNGRLDREQFLKKVSEVEGVYVPRFYSFEYNPDGTVRDFSSEIPSHRVIKRVVRNFDNVYFPTRPLVPITEVIHDRMMVEAARGCVRGCRFCQAGVIYRPVREKSKDNLIKQAEELARSTGHGEISLVSLNTADYSSINDLALELSKRLENRRISISLPSLRVDRFSVDLARAVQRVRKSTLTFAPEAGTQRLRDVINKGVSEEDLWEAVSAAFEAGWDRIKLYFMIGLPTETEEDIDGIVRLSRGVLELGRKIRGKDAGRVKVTVSVSSFVPKSHTPLQWAAQDRIEVLKEKQDYLKRNLRGKGLVFNWHDAQQSFLEAVLAKGNRETGKVIFSAWLKGCKFDSWAEFFDFDKWKTAFEEQGYDPFSYVNFPWKTDAVLPWDHIDTGVSKKFLIREYERALKEIPTESCMGGRCAGCGLCPALEVYPEIRGGD